MKYLLDTDIIIGHLRRGEKINVDWAVEGVATSVISWMELFFGIFNGRQSEKNQKSLESFCDDINLEVIEMSKEVAEKAAEIKVNLRHKGQELVDFDLLIAATAITNNLVLVTGNKHHFARIPELKIYGSSSAIPIGQ